MAAKSAQRAAPQAEKAGPKVKTYPFWLGGAAASIAVCFTHPLDLMKLRMQNSPTKTTTLHLLRDTIKTQGVSGLYVGVSASILRQMTYSLTR